MARQLKSKRKSSGSFWRSRHGLGKLRLVLVGLGIGAGVLYALLAFAMRLYQQQQQAEFMLITYDLCRQQNITILADQMGLDYRLLTEHDFEYPPITVIGTAQQIADFNKRYEQIYADQPSFYYTHDEKTINKTCHLHAIKHHTDNINAKLLPYIPNDADHVSYYPNPKGSQNDKAVYCHYVAGEKGGSRCYFIQLLKDRLIKDDISDMERANLAKMNRLYSLRQDVDDMRLVRSWVVDWNAPANKIYGFRLQTNYDGRRWGIIESY